MVRKNMKSALSASLKAEDEAFKSRFERAEAILGDTNSSQSEVTSDSDPLSSQKLLKKERVIRDSFTLPEADHALIAAIKQRCLKGAVNVTKSEVVRAGLHALSSLPERELLEVMDNLTKVKTGRPPKTN